MDLKASTIVKGIFVTVLLIIFALFYLKDALSKYLSDAKNVSTRQENAADGIDFPALTLCLNPSLQQAALDNLGIHSITFAHGHFSEDLDMSPLELYENVSYILNRDFKIFIRITLSPNTHMHVLKEGNNAIKMHNSSMFNVEIKKTWSYIDNLCYLILIDRILTTDQRLMTSMHISLIDKASNEPKKAKLYYSSKEQFSLSVVGDNMELIPKCAEFNFDSGYSTMVGFTERRHKRVECEDGIKDSYTCFAERINKETFESCPTKCLPLAYQFLEDRIRTSTFVKCQTLEEETCMRDQILLSPRSRATINRCLNICSLRTYEAQIVETQLRYSGRKSIYLLLRAASDSRIIKEEYYIYDTPTLIGTLGGSLGLFLGFSFYDYISQAIDFLFEHFTE